MSDVGGSIGHGQESTEAEAVLRAKYLDYCSAQVADLLLLLSPDEIYVLAQEAHRKGGRPDELSYSRMVQLATASVSRRAVLPPFDVWAEDYQKNPERYEAYLMGLWRSEVDDGS
ncbi:MAG: hypothetical protein IH968_05335 [Gemmatimonadetes bacterium]|nr:hypothetical protein [Gemmatimonadota bacterium]